MSYSEIPGGVTAAQGFVAGSAFCGIKATNASRPDMALIHSPTPSVAAATFTTKPGEGGSGARLGDSPALVGCARDHCQLR
jgi:N-acetylglutamate synthase/N-acetylornithine aminotransferase